MIVESPINPAGPSLPLNIEPDPAPTILHSPQSGGQPLSTPPQPLPPLHAPSHPLSIPDNIQALWTRTEHTQRAMEDHDCHIHALSTQLNKILQAFTGLQRNHQLLQDMVRLNDQEVDEEIATLHFQLDFIWDECLPTPNLSIFATADPNQPPSIPTSPHLQVTTISNPVVLSTAEPNLKPVKPDMWNSTDHNAKPFWNRVLNYLGSFSGMAFSKQIVFILSPMTHAKSQSWTNTHQNWLTNNPSRLPPTIARLLEDFIQEFGDRNAAVSAQHWIDTTFQGQRTVIQFNNDWLAKVDEAGYIDTLLLVSHYLSHLNKMVQDAILALDMMPSKKHILCSFWCFCLQYISQKHLLYF